MIPTGCFLFPVANAYDLSDINPDIFRSISQTSIHFMQLNTINWFCFIVFHSTSIWLTFQNMRTEHCFPVLAYVNPMCSMRGCPVAF